MLSRKIKEEVERCKEYATANILPLIIGTIVFICCFIPYMASSRMGIDSYYYVYDSDFLYNWMDIGRWGAVFFKKIFDSEFSLYYVAAAAVIIYLIVMFCMCRLFHRVGNIKCGYSVLAFLLIFISPIFAEQYYFTNQMIEIAIGSLILFVALNFNWKFIESNRITYAIGAMFCIAVDISIYQSFCIMYISGVCFEMLIYYRKKFIIGKACQSDKNKENLFLLIKQIGIFLAGYILYMLIVKLTGAQGSYLASQIAWGNSSKRECIRNIIITGMDIVLGKGSYYSIAYSLLGIIVLGIIFYDVLKEKTKERYIYLLSGIGLVGAPFLLLIYMGQRPFFRSQMAFPFVVGCMICFILICLNNQIKRVGVYVLAIFILIGQIRMFSRLQYTEDFVYEKDKTLLIDIYQDVKKISGDREIRWAIVGSADIRLNSTCVADAEMCQVSVINYCFHFKPYYYWPTQDTGPFLTALGYPCSGVDEKELWEARKEAIDMPSYPAEGSIKDMESYFIVKLSEDMFIDELLSN